MANIKDILTTSSKKIANRAKKIAKGASNTVNQIKTVSGKIKRGIEIPIELAAIKLTITSTKIEYQGELNKLENKLNTESFSNYSSYNYYEDVEKTDKFYKERLQLLDEQYKALQEEFNKLDDNFFGLKKTEAEKLAILKSDKKDEDLNNTKNKLQFPKSYVDIITTLSTVVSTLLQFISVNNAKIENLVNSVNGIILKATTKQEIEQARLLRNQAISIIQTNKTQLDNVNKIINIIEVITTILNPIISALSFLPPLAITGATIRLLQKLETILNDSTALLSVSNLVVNKLIENLNYQESRLLQLNNILDNNIDNLTADEISNLLNSNKYGLGYLKGFDYKGFKFFIKEEEDPKFEIKGNKRRYAVAVNKDGNDILKSESSFTLDPDVLVEELKLIIDQKNLVA